MSNPSNDKNEKLLVSVNRGYEADLIKGSLQNAKIPFYTKEHSGPAGFARFDTKYKEGDIEFWVPANLLDKAKEILPPVRGTEEIQNEMAQKEAAADSNEDNTSKEKDAKAEVKGDDAPMPTSKRVFFTILFLVVAIAIIFGVDAVMNIVRTAMGWQ